VQRFAYQPYLRELLAHWDGSFRREASFGFDSTDDAVAFFETYQRALGDNLRNTGISSFVPRYTPTREMILNFMAGFRYLRRGDPLKAEQQFTELIHLSESRMAEAWLWLSATTDDDQLRLQYLENTLESEPTHPLASDAMEILRGDANPEKTAAKDKVVLTQCPKCGGALHYEPGATHVACAYCGTSTDLNKVDLIDGQAASLRSLRLGRLLQVAPWQEAQRILGCMACGAELTMTKHIARRCNFCGSTNVIVEDTQRQLQQPDGVLPFLINQGQATAAIEELQQPGWEGFQVWSRAWFGQGLTFLPLARPLDFWETMKPWRLARKYKIGPILGFYLPFWVFDGTVVKAPDPDGPEHRKVSYENIVYPGVSTLDSLVLEGIQPYNLSALVPYKPKLIADWPAQLYDSDVENVVEQAYTLMVALTRKSSGRPDQRCQVTDSTFQLILLPVWAALLGRKDQRLLAMVNGQTGKVAFGEI